MIEEEWHRKVRSLPGTEIGPHLYQTDSRIVSEWPRLNDGIPLEVAFLSVTEREGLYPRGIYPSANVTLKSLLGSVEIASAFYRYINRTLNPPRNPTLEARLGVDISRCFLIVPYAINSRGLIIVKMQLLTVSQAGTLLQSINKTQQE